MKFFSIVVCALLSVSSLAQTVATPTQISIADKKYELDQLRISNAMNAYSAASANAQLTYNDAVLPAQIELQKIFSQVMDELAIPESEHTLWSYNPQTKMFSKKSTAAPVHPAAAPVQPDAGKDTPNETKK